MIIRRIGNIQLPLTYTSVYPPAYSDTYVKATSKYNTSYWSYYACDPTNSLTGTRAGNSWLASTITDRRFHINLGSAKSIYRIYYENAHHSGTEPNTGCKNFTFWGSNSATAFADLVYANDADWERIFTDITQMEEHVANDQADPKYIYVISGVNEYRYYAFKFADNWGDDAYIGIRRIELQEGK